MSRIITLVVAVVAAALVAVPLAAGQSPDALERAVQARELSNRTSSVVVGDAFERATVAQARSGALDRSIGLNRQYGLGEFAAVPRDAFERAAEAGRTVSGTGDRSIGLNRTYRLGDFASVPVSDTHDRVAPVSEPISTPTVGSGRDLDWPQLGIGFGIGLLLAAGLLMALRMTRIRPLAH